MDDREKAAEMQKKILDRQQKMLEERAEHERQLQARFLDARQSGLEQAAELILLQAEAAGGSPVGPAKPVYTRQQLEEFASGDMVKCLGNDFAVYQGRRTPRIPNGELLLMSRVLSAQGERFHPSAGGEIVVEYDVPPAAWFYRDNSYPYMPYSVYMEIALQPCGFLAAHLGTQLMFPEVDYFFRNLDGEGRILRLINLGGKTISTHARLEKTMVSGKQIIQKFAFRLTCGGQSIFEGSSVFGFFPPDAMANQMGLDGKQETLPLYELPGQNGLAGKHFEIDENPLSQDLDQKLYYRMPGGYFKFLSQVFISPDGGRERKGYAYANKPVDGQDWFYACHFFQDPVMPGSLGVEAILEAMQAFALECDLGRGFKSPRFDLVPGHTIAWKYRGQILPTHKIMKLEVHLTQIEQRVDQVLLVGDASLWADGIRIYEVKDAAIRLVEGYDGQ